MAILFLLTHKKRILPGMNRFQKQIKIGDKIEAILKIEAFVFCITYLVPVIS